MRRLFLCCFLCFATVCQAYAQEWEITGKDIRKVDVVAASRLKKGLIFAGSSSGLFRSQDSGISWKRVLSLRGENPRVNFLYFHQNEPDSVYAATTGGLFFSKDSGISWKRVFHKFDESSNNCRAVMVFSNRVYLGTSKGLFFSEDNARTWSRYPGELGKKEIYSFCTDSKDMESVYLVTSEAVYKNSRNINASWQQLFAGFQEEDREEQIFSEEQEEPEKKYILAINPLDSGNIFLIEGKRLWETRDCGLTWQRFPAYGLISSKLNSLFINDRGKIYVATNKGIFVFQDEGWQEVSGGRKAACFNSLTFDKENCLYAGSSEGVFKLRDASAKKTAGLISFYLEGEPDIKEIQKAAIKYADVEPEKIISWRRQAAKKGILPRLSISIDRDTGDLWHWESGSSTKVYDDILVKGKDAIGWDVTLSWDLSQLIWNSEQTSIDTRSRLMVQLREDILEEVTSLFYERIRIKMGLDQLSIEDRKKIREKELKLLELTSRLDALTGGYYSSRLNRRFP